MAKKSIAVAKGDGIGPEIMDVVMDIFKNLNIDINYTLIDMGKSVFEKGHKLGMTDEAKNTVEKLGILFKGPMETPKGGGNRSINVTARKMWGTYANCRVFKTLPGVETIYSKSGIPINLTIIRENLEDTYGGVEHLLNPDLAISRRFISAPGSYAIHKYAFEYAQQNGIKNVACGHKANIMKLTDGMFLDTFYEVAKKYPDIKASDVIVDDLCMKLVTIPNKFEVVVLPNLQGDIVSDLCAGLVGGLGFAPSANIGNNVNIFEAVHGTAPDIAGKDLANPTALLLSGLMLLNHLGFVKEAKKIELGLLKTLQRKIHTADLKISNHPVSTTEYGKAIIENTLSIEDNHPEIVNLKGVKITESTNKNTTDKPVIITHRKAKDIQCVGVDIFIESNDQAEIIAQQVNSKLGNGFKLEIISNRGIGVYPDYSKYTECINSYIVRIKAQGETSEEELLKLCLQLQPVVKISSIEMLRNYDGKAGYSVI